MNILKKIGDQTVGNDYLCHSRNSNLYVKKGMKVVKLRIVKTITQKPLMKNSMDRKTEVRAK